MATQSPSPTPNNTGRLEDDALLRGRGHYVADNPRQGQLSAFFVRSPHAFASIRHISLELALERPGVVAILTSADMDAAGVGSISQLVPIGGPAEVLAPKWSALAHDRVMYVGQPVCMVVAETRQQAEEASEFVSIDYEELDSVTDVRDAVLPDAPQLWPNVPGNVAVQWSPPTIEPEVAARAKEIISSAKTVARVELVNQRIAAVSLEPRGAVANYDSDAAQYFLRCGCQSVWTMRSYLSSIMNFPPERLRVVSDDVGGAFGMKSTPYPEYIALLVAAERLRQPIQWISGRGESFMSDNHARDMILRGELALNDEGDFLALNVEVLANMGAFLSATGPLTATVNMAMCLPSVYHIPYVAMTSQCVFTNSVQTGAYRGAGRPEANYLIERLIEAAADLVKIDRVALRRKNLITPNMMPYRTPLGMTYDSGAFLELFERALDVSDYAGFAHRRAHSARAGKLRGIGVACYLEQTGGALREGAAISFLDNRVALSLGGQASGQGHLTVFSELTSKLLGLAPEQVVVRQGDTNLNVVGSGTVGSRSAVMVGAASKRTIETMLMKAKAVASLLLETAETDIVYSNGTFVVSGTDHKISLFEVASKAVELKAAGALQETLDTNLVTEAMPTFPNGCHIAEVEIDADTGHVDIVAYTAIQDSGQVLNSMIATGQLQGGLAQGLGQVLCEEVTYDRLNGQLLSASFMDYGIPRAHHLPDDLRCEFIQVPSTTNSFGVKGIGEGGTTGSLGATMNAIIDALPQGAEKTLDMPATPNRVWRSLQTAKRPGA